MNRGDVPELHYITAIENVASMLRLGILSHKKAAKVVHSSVAMEEVQERRRKKQVPGGRPLHDYVNLYFSARNPMLYKILAKHQELCVLRAEPALLDVPNVVISDGNAAAGSAAFFASPGGLRFLNRDLVFAEYWTDPDQIVGWRKKVAKCAEVLVPDRVDPRYVRGAWVSCDEAQAKLVAQCSRLDVTVNKHLFFRG